mgnify:CR=1 FL=1
MRKSWLLFLIFTIVIISYSFNYAFATFCNNEFSSDILWIYVEASINGNDPSSSSGYDFIDSGGLCPSDTKILRIATVSYTHLTLPVSWARRCV